MDSSRVCSAWSLLFSVYHARRMIVDFWKSPAIRTAPRSAASCPKGAFLQPDQCASELAIQIPPPSASNASRRVFRKRPVYRLPANTFKDASEPAGLMSFPHASNCSATGAVIRAGWRSGFGGCRGGEIQLANGDCHQVEHIMKSYLVGVKDSEQ
jgi:hypothetical protein